MTLDLVAAKAWLRTLRHRPALLTILANNSSTLSFTFVSLISVPIALHHLGANEFGLWAFTSQSVGYFLLLDLGVSVAISRLLAAPLASGDAVTANQWFTLSLLVMAGQALVMGVAGWMFVDPLLRWFEIPVELTDQARVLWLWILGCSIVNYLTRSMSGILYAQNRFYWSGFGNMLGAWVGLAAFVWLLNHGNGVLAYAYSSAIQTVCICSIPWLGVRLGADRFRLDLRGIGWVRLRELYGFSGALSLIQIANVILVAGQTLVITKILGLKAAAGYNVSSKVIMTLRNVLWQLHESFLPGWQRLYLKGQFSELVRQWRLRFDLIMSTALTMTTVFIAVNPWFVSVWARPDLHQGFPFDLAAALFCLATMVMAGFAFPQTFAMRVWVRSVLQVMAAVLSILLGVLWTPFAGTAGVFWAGTTGYVVGTIWYNIRQFNRLLARPSGATFNLAGWNCFHALAAFAVSAILIGAFRHHSDPARIVLAAVIVAGSVGLFFRDWKRSLISLLNGRYDALRPSAPRPASSNEPEQEQLDSRTP